MAKCLSDFSADPERLGAQLGVTGMLPEVPRPPGRAEQKSATQETFQKKI